MPTTTQPNLTFEQELESHRRGLTGYCYRMLGSASEAEDAVQEAMVRAWRASNQLTAPGALKSWLYRIASNVCIDQIQSPQRRAMPMDLSPAGKAAGELGAPLPETAWVHPIASGRVLGGGGDPADVAGSRETLRLAFVAALQHLPAKQRAVLVLCEVLRWKASEAATLLDISVASVNSALQRARATLSTLDLDAEGVSAGAAPDEEQAALLEQYVDAFEAYDITRLVSLLRDDATFTMPPLPLWLRGAQEAGQFMLGTGAKCEGSRALPTTANGGPAAAIYNPVGDGTYAPWAVVVLETEDGKIAALHHYIGGPEWFAEFGLPAQLADDAKPVTAA
ncbi:MAG: sigma-70 family RNA polymerase sigma factor [Patulibacter sp.]